MDEEEYTDWRVLQEEAELDPHHKENLLKESYRRMEKELELLGVTAIEDRLQVWNLQHSVIWLPSPVSSLRMESLRLSSLSEWEECTFGC